MNIDNICILFLFTELDPKKEKKKRKDSRYIYIYIERTGWLPSFCLLLVLFFFKNFFFYNIYSSILWNDLSYLKINEKSVRETVPKPKGLSF